MNGHDRLRCGEMLGFLIASVLLASGCYRGQSKEPDDNKLGRAGKPDAAGQLRVLKELPPFTLTDQAGEDYGTQQLDGKVWVATFIFTRCAATCPKQTANMAELQRRLEKNPDNEDIRLVSITVDPEYDTPSVLRDYADAHQADHARWHFLTGQHESIRKLCEKGFLQPMGAEGGPVGHSSKLILIDRLRRIRSFYEGTQEKELESIQRDLKQLL